MDFIIENKLVLLAALLAVSEALALIPALKSNSVFQLIVNSIKSIYGMVKAPKAAE